MVVVDGGSKKDEDCKMTSAFGGSSPGSSSTLKRQVSFAGFGFDDNDGSNKRNSAYEAMEMKAITSKMSPEPAESSAAAIDEDDVWDNLDEDPYAKVQAERQVQDRNEALKIQLEQLKHILAQKDAQIKSFASKYHSRAATRGLSKAVEEEGDYDDDAGEFISPSQEGSAYLIPNVPADAVKKVEKKPLKRKGSVVGQTIVKGIKNASDKLKQELYNSPRFTPKECINIKKNLASKRLGNGMIGKSDFQKVMSKEKKIKQSSSYTATVFQLLDVQSLGFVRYKDFKFLLAVFCDGSPGMRLRELFLSFDENGDGKLSLDELTNLVSMLTALRPSSFEGNMTDAQIAEMLFIELDEDHDGDISAEEFVYHTQESDELSEVFLGLVDGFKTEAEGRKKRQSITTIMQDLDQGADQEGVFGVHEFNKDMIGRSKLDNTDEDGGELVTMDVEPTQSKQNLKEQKEMEKKEQKEQRERDKQEKKEKERLEKEEKKEKERKAKAEKKHKSAPAPDNSPAAPSNAPDNSPAPPANAPSNAASGAKSTDLTVPERAANGICAYVSDEGRHCRKTAISLQALCPAHTCTFPNCKYPKSSRERFCKVHNIEDSDSDEDTVFGFGNA